MYWLIWQQRNTVMHGGAFQHPSRSYQCALDYLREYIEAQDQLSVTVSIPTSVNHTWQPLQGMFYKLNFDGASFDNGAVSGYGAIIRNVNGEVMAALLAKGGAVGDGEEVEVMACCKSLEFAVDAGFTEVILEGDNATVLKMISQLNQTFLGLG